MGIVLDTSILIAGERRAESVRQILKRVEASQGQVDTAISVVTVVELTHGVYRAKADADNKFDLLSTIFIRFAFAPTVRTFGTLPRQHRNM